MRKHVVGAQTRGWQLFNKNTGLCSPNCSSSVLCVLGFLAKRSIQSACAGGRMPLALVSHPKKKPPHGCRGLG